MKKILLNILILIIALTLGGCTSNVDNDTLVNISILNSKPEFQPALETAINEFTKENPNIKIKSVKYSQNMLPSNKLNSLYGTENAPTISLVDSSELFIYKDKLSTLNNEKWAQQFSNDISSISKNDNNDIIALPFADEGMALIYNKDVLTKAGVDPSNINTISSLEDAFKKIDAIGKKGIIITNEAWSLGDHFFTTAFSIQSNNTYDIAEYYSNVKTGKVNLQSDSKINGLLDTFDLMKKYNLYASSPLQPSYDRCIEAISNGEVGFWYMGNWVSNLLTNQSSIKDNFGFIPIPISNNSSDYGNNEIVVGTTKYFIIDKENNSVEQQEAAKKFLDWLVYDDTAENLIINEASIIPALLEDTPVTNDPLTNSLLTFRSNGNTLEFALPYLPKSNADNVGNEMRKYLSGEIDRSALLKNIQEFYKAN